MLLVNTELALWRYDNAFLFPNKWEVDFGIWLVEKWEANDIKHFKIFCNSVVSVTVEIELKSLKVPRDLYECERAV
jgi:hypothetical protein